MSCVKLNGNPEAKSWNDHPSLASYRPRPLVAASETVVKPPRPRKVESAHSEHDATGDSELDATGDSELDATGDSERDATPVPSRVVILRLADCVKHA